MKKLNIVLVLLVFFTLGAFGQTAYNPFTQNIHFVPEPSAAGFECGSTPSVAFTMGLTTAADATQWQTDPLTVTICLGGFTFNGPASSIVSGSYASNFNWAFSSTSPNCIIGTQNQTLPGTGSNPIFPNPLSSGGIVINLKVPENSPVSTVLSVDVTLQVPAYMATFNSIPDDNESTQTQTFCNCYALTDGGVIAASQVFCGSGNPVIFTNVTSPSGGSGGVVLYQWQQLVGSIWTDIPGATDSVYDAPLTTASAEYRRTAKRSLCGVWVNSNALTITVNPSPTADAGTDKTLTCLTTSTQIGTPQVAGLSYSWSPAVGLSSSNIAQPTATPSVTTTYTLTVTNAFNCTATDVVVVNVNTTPPLADAGSDKTLDCITTSTIIGTPAVAGYLYAWTPTVGLSASNIAQPTANPTSTTTYTVTVTGTNGCISTDVVVVTVNTTPPTANAGPNKITTCTSVSAIIGTPAIAGNSYSWNPALGLSSSSVAEPVANPAATTTYTLTVTGSNGCTATSTVTVTVNKTPPVADAGPNRSLNCTTTSATIGSTAISGSTYSWTPATGLSATNIAQPTASPTVTTTYTVTVTGANGCTATSSVLVSVDLTAPIANAGPNQITTCTTVSATIGTTAVSGNAYSWSPSAGLSGANVAQPIANPLATTTYTLTVTGTNGCTATSTVTVTVNKTPPVADAGPDRNLTCSVTSASIGTTAISGNTYTWTPSTGLSATNIAQPIASPTTTTTYTVTVTGANGCTATDVVVVNVNTSLPVANAGPAQTVTCATTSVTIGTALVSGNSYSWSPASGLSATNVAQPIASPSSTTTYTLTVTGSNGCTATSSVTVTVNTTPPTANAGPNKTVNCSVTSVIIGTPSIAGNTYSWAPSSGLSATNIAEPTANPSATTTYTVTVTGTNGCTATSTVTVFIDLSTPVANAGLNQITTCLVPTASIGTAAISGNTYSWSPTLGLSANNVAQPIANPAATTTYTLTVTGSNGCTATSTVTVTVNKTPPVANAGPDKTVNCVSTSTQIGTAPIAGNTYAWVPATGLSATNIAQPTASPSATTVYTLTVTGTNGCTATSTVTITVNTAPPVANAGPNQITTCTVATATIGTVSIAGNSYNWTPATGLSATNVAQPIANPASTTTYTLLVTGSNGCSATSTVTVTVNKTPPVADAGPNRNLNCTTTSATIGTASIAGNTYAWSPATGLSANNIAQPIASPVITTVYTVTVTGTNGCTATSTVTVNVNTALPVADAGPTRNLNCTTTSATIGTTAIAGNTYSWLPASGLSATNVAQPTASPISNTVYTVTVTGSNGCTATSTVTVNVNTTPPIAGAGPNQTLTCLVTSATIGTTAIAGTSYSWAPASGLSATNIAQPTASPTTTTIYTVTATGTNGCTATSTVTVSVNTTPPVANAGPDRNLNCSNTSTIIGTTAIAGNAYAWSPASGLNSTTVAQPTANPAITTTYTVTVTGANGCTATSTVIVNVNTTTPVADAGPDRNLNCTTTSATIGTAAVAGNSYSWLPASGLSSTTVAQPTASPTISTSYTVTVTGSNGCTSTDVMQVNVNTTLPVADAGPDRNLTCASTSATLGTAAVAGNTYSWSPATGLSASNVAQPIANPTTNTTYTLTVTGSNGCVAVDVVIVNVNVSLPTANAGPNRNLNCTVTSAIIGTTAISGNTYAWTPTTGLNSSTVAQPTASPTSTTTYTVLVTGANGCTATSTVTVNVNTTPPVADAGPDKNLDCITSFVNIGAASVSGNTYTWTPAAGLNSTSISMPVASPAVSTTYTVTVTGANGCTATDVVNIGVNTTVPVADAGPDRFLTCSNPSATIGAGAIPGYSYVWTPSTGLSAANIAQPIASPASTTVYSLTVSGTNGCTATDVVLVNVNNVVPTITVSGTPIVCNNSLATMTASANIGTITWSNGSSVATQNLAAGTYTVTANNNGCIASTVVTIIVREATVGNYVWTDLNADGINNEPASAGINGVTVQLFSVGLDNTQGTSDDQLVGTTVTANNTTGDPGYYRFVVCTSGNYYVKFPLSTNANDTLTNPTTTAGVDNNSDANMITGFSPVFNLNVNGTGISKDNMTIDAGYLQTISLGNLVWNDANLNGVRDGSESGINGATVYLFADNNNDGLPDGSALSIVITGSNGLYAFNDLYPGNYIVGVEPPVPTSGNMYVSSVTGEEINPNLNVDNNDNGIVTTGGITYSGTITLLGGTEPLGESPNNGSSPDASSNLTVDFGFYQPVNIYGNVFNDINGPANVDGTGIGFPGGLPLFVNLVNSSGIVVAVTPVNPDGTWSIFDVIPGATYTAQLSTLPGLVGSTPPPVQLPNGWSNVSEDCCDNTGNDGTTNGITTIVMGNTDLFNANFGIREPLSLGNFVWNDLNRNGLVNVSEPGIVGATVRLYADNNNDGIPDGAAVATTTTNGSGAYVFNGLNPGNYIIGVVPPAVTGGSYTSSAGGELNPNLNIDNNDNGIATNAGETFSGTVTLLAGTEPLNELPNNASAPDNNANLTVDFGFFVCPTNFTFTPVYLCPGNTVNLATLEPIGFTGGVWTNSSGAVLTNLVVSSGTFTYSFTSGTCNATGSVLVAPNIPDYTPTIAISPSAITGTTNVRVILTVDEINNRPSCSDVFVLVPRLEPRFTFVYDPVATNIGGVPVTNAEWQYFSTNPNFYVWKYVGNATFPSSGSSKFGYIGPYNPNQTDGETTFSVQIFQGSGGESNLTNNTDSEILIYFR